MKTSEDVCVPEKFLLGVQVRLLYKAVKMKDGFQWRPQDVGDAKNCVMYAKDNYLQ